ncbi:hypothetical protein BGZ76_005052, partial [Entomortierella beljakovae]
MSESSMPPKTSVSSPVQDDVNMDYVTDSLRSTSVSFGEEVDSTLVIPTLTPSLSAIPPPLSSIPPPLPRLAFAQTNPVELQHSTTNSVVEQYKDKISEWHSEIVELEKTLFNETDAARQDALTAGIKRREQWIDREWDARDGSTKATHRTTTIQAKVREPKVKSLGTDDDVASWSEYFEETINTYMSDHQRIGVPFTAMTLQKLWNNSLPVTVEYRNFLQTMRSEGAFHHPTVVMDAFRESFADYSMVTRYHQFLSIVWKAEQPFRVFADAFRSVIKHVGVSEDVVSTRGLVAQRFLQCLPEEFNFSEVMAQYSDAPPLSKLIKSASKQATSLRRSRGTGRFHRLESDIAALYSAGSKLPASVARDTTSTSSASSTSTSSHAHDGNRRKHNGAIRNDNKHSSSSRHSKPYDASSVKSWCYRCNGDNHLSNKCEDRDAFPGPYQFKPLENGDRPFGGKRKGKSSVSFAHVGLMPGCDNPLTDGYLSSSSSLSSSTSTSEFSLDKFDDDELSFLNSRIPLNKDDDLQYLSQSILRIVRLLPSEGSIQFPILVENRPYIALVDTGSTITCISSRIVDEIKVMVIPALENDPPIQLANADSFTSRIGCTPPIILNAEGKIVHHACEIMDLPDGYDVLIGLDTFYKFGLGIHGLPAGRALPKPFPSFTEGASPARVPEIVAEVERSPEFITARE